MINTLEMFQELRQTMDPAAAEKIAQVIGRVYQQLHETVTKAEFKELRDVVAELAGAQKELAAAQQRTERRVEELAAAQQRTEQRVEELTAAQLRTEQRVEELAGAQKELAEAMKQTQAEIGALTQEVKDTRGDLGGLARSSSYALENEAYRMLPKFLREKYSIDITQHFVRTEIAKQEINLFARGRRNGQEALLVGETKLRLDERRPSRKGQKDIFHQLDEKIRAVQSAHPGAEIIPLLLTHYARPKVLEQARAQGIIVVQSFEW